MLNSMEATAGFRTADLDTARHYMTGIFRSHRLSFAGRERDLDMRHRRLSFGAVSVHWLGYGGRVVLESDDMERFYLFQVNLSGSCNIRHGSDEAMVEAEHGYAVNPDEPFRKEWSRDCRQLIVRVERDALDRFLRQELSVDRARALSFTATPSHMPELARLVQTLSVDGIGNAPRIARHAEPLLLSLLLSRFDHSHAEGFRRPAAPPAPAAVRRVERFIAEHLADAIGLAEMVAVAGCSTRSLYNGFRRFRDTTPMEYLKAARLDAARAMLRREEADSGVVTRVALACGYESPSRFARDFRARFGETPSTVAKGSG